ncbi:MAG: hypothetical protein OSA98_13180 [Rubripirellula sp.]|nr:hypothetical protein [Rubripirellula sp.]
MQNPYVSTSVDSGPEADVGRYLPNPVVLGLSWGGWLYPVLVLVSLYGTWLLAWVALGSIPVPMRDDPKGISMITLPYIMTNVLLMVAPVGCIAGVLGQFLYHGRTMMFRFLHAGGVALLWFGSFSLVGWDPGRVVEWFFD